METPRKISPDPWTFSAFSSFSIFLTTHLKVPPFPLPFTGSGNTNNPQSSVPGLLWSLYAFPEWLDSFSQIPLSPLCRQLTNLRFLPGPLNFVTTQNLKVHKGNFMQQYSWVVKNILVTVKGLKKEKRLLHVHLTNKPILGKLVQLSSVIQRTLVQGLNVHAFHQDKGTEVAGKEKSVRKSWVLLYPHWK